MTKTVINTTLSQFCCCLISHPAWEFMIKYPAVLSAGKLGELGTGLSGVHCNTEHEKVTLYVEGQ